MKVAGIDVSAYSIEVAVGKNRPSNPTKVSTTKITSVSSLIALKLDIAVLEPTGGHYSRLWIEALKKTGCQVFLVGHKELKNYREFLGFRDKEDRLDAITLLYYYFDFKDTPSRFLFVRPQICEDLRDYYFRLKFYSKLRVKLVNRLRQDLAWQFPEQANKSIFDREDHKPPSPFIRWISGEEQALRYEKILSQSYGLGLADDTCFMGELIFEIMSQEQYLEGLLFDLLEAPELEPYLEALNCFGMKGLRTQAFLISQLYPLAQFLGEDGPIIERNPTRRISEDKFKARLATVPTKDWSGKSRKFRKSGSSEARLVLWQWFFCKIEKPSNRPDTEPVKEIVALWEAGKASGIPTKKLRAKCRSKAAKLLFRYLVKALL